MHSKPVSALVAVTLLVLASLACNTITGGGLNNAQATADAALTAAFSGDFEATAESAEATAEAAIDGIDEATTEPEPTEADDDPPQATEEPIATDTTGFGGEAPDDVPIIDAENTILFTSAEIVSYQTTADYQTTVTFYKDGMPDNGWSIDPNASVETDTATILYCTKDNRQASVSITVDSNTNTVLVLVTISAN
jgi:hypothetical protein